MYSKKTIIALVVLVAIAAIAYYQITGNETARQAVDSESAEEVAIYENYSATVDFEYPGGSHTVEFTFVVDGDGMIEKVTALEVNDPSAQERIDAFAESVTPIVAGKKLSELGAVDKVGTSSLTTDAFNESLEKVQEQL